MADLYKLEDGKLTLDFHPGQTAAWVSQKRMIFMIAGTQSGKTAFEPFWLHREIMNKGSGDYLAVTSSYDLFNLKFLPTMRYVFEDLFQVGRYHASKRVIEIKDPGTGEFWARNADDPMWARIILRSASAPSGLESATVKAAVLDECGQEEFTLLTFEAVLRRLSLSQGRILGATTPYFMNWLKWTIIDPWAKGAPDIDVISFASTLNPNFPKAEYNERKRTMPAWRFNMMYNGLFTRPAGMIYSDFKDAHRAEKGHKVTPFTIPVQWERYVGVDPGGVNVGKIFIAHDPDQDIFYIYRESLEGDKTTREHVQEVMAWKKEAGENIVGIGIGAKAEVQVRRDWIDQGAVGVIEPTVTDVEAGIDRVIELLKTYRIFIFDTLEGLLTEILNYRRATDDAGKVLEKIVEKETYHLLDALRYAVARALDGNSMEDFMMQGLIRERMSDEL